MAKGDTRQIPLPDRNRLWADSGFVCGNPDCRAPVLEEDAGFTVTLGKIAHIHGHKPGAARYDPGLDPHVRESYSNLIILCDPCHTKIDHQEDSYPADLLQEWKDRQRKLLTTLGQTVGGSAPPPLSYHYVDRSEVESKVIDKLNFAGRVVLTGLSGCGKTQLAAHLIDQLEDSYSFRWWIRATDIETLYSDLAGIGPSIGVRSAENEPVSTTAQRVVRALGGRGTWLMVIDNVGGSPDELNLLPTGAGHVIVTTQNAGLALYGEQISVPPLTRDESEFLLRKSTTSDAEGNPTAFERIHDLAFGHPLVISQAASHISATGMSPERYADFFASRRSDVLSRGTDVNHASLTASVNLAVGELSRAGLFLCFVLSQLASSPYPIPELFDPLGIWPVLSDELAIEDALADLRRFSLVERDTEQVSMHALSKEIVLAGLSHEQRGHALYAAMTTLGTRLPERTERLEARETMTWMLPHLLATLDRAAATPDFPELEKGEVTILNRTAIYLQSRGEIEQAEKLLTRAATRLSDPIQADDVAQLGSVLNNLGNIQKDQGNCVAAEATLRRALELKQQGHPPGHLLIGITLAALAVAIDLNGRPGEAVRLHERALVIYRANGATTRVADSLNDLAALATKRGEPATARGLLEESILLTSDLSDAWPETVRAYRGLSAIARSENRLMDAARAARQAVDAARTAGPSKILADALHDRGMLMAEVGNPARAVNLLKEARKVMAEVEEPILGAYILGDLGYVQVSGHLTTEGLANLYESERDISSHLPADHIRVVVSKRMLANAVAGSGHLRKSEAILVNAIEDARAANPEAPHTGISWLEDDLGRVRAALKLSHKYQQFFAGDAPRNPP